MCDVYSAHLDEAVLTEALHCGYVLVHCGGSCAGVLHCNDTHLRQPLSAMYQELEQHDLMERSRLQPSACARRDREDCLRDAIAAWQRRSLHELAARGRWDQMLCNALDGSEDALACGEAARLWEELRMAEKRTAAVAEVDREYAAGRLCWEGVGSLVHPFPQRGVLDEYREGQEDEGEAPGGKSWSDRGELSSASEGLEDTSCRAGGEGPAVGEATTVEESRSRRRASTDPRNGVPGKGVRTSARGDDLAASIAHAEATT